MAALFPNVIARSAASTSDAISGTQDPHLSPHTSLRGRAHFVPTRQSLVPRDHTNENEGTPKERLPRATSVVLAMTKVTVYFTIRVFKESGLTLTPLSSSPSFSIILLFIKEPSMKGLAPKGS